MQDEQMEEDSFLALLVLAQRMTLPRADLGALLDKSVVSLCPHTNLVVIVVKGIVKFDGWIERI